MDDSIKRTEVALRVLFSTFDKTANPDMLRGYLLGLRNLTADEIELAVFKAISDCKIFPKPADLIELAGAQTSDYRSLLAWNDVLGAVDSMGAYRSVDFEDPICNATIRNLGGWVNFITLLSSGRDVDFTRSKFLKTYKTLAESVVRDAEICRPLQGLATFDPPRIYRIRSTSLQKSLPEGTSDFGAIIVESIRARMVESREIHTT